MTTTTDPSREFTKDQVNNLLTAVINKTLLQVDAAKLFEHHEGRDKVKGIAGDIIEESPVVMKVMQTYTTCIQHSLQETLILCTNRSHYSLCGQSFASSSHRQPNALKLRTRYIAKGYTHVRDLHHFSNFRAFAPS